ncbi:MAG: CoA pyrophosphatase [Cryomorphaceae bacterium]|nr:CoA pyrophosphatase [Cryomorphaceae bacterium]
MQKEEIIFWKHQLSQQLPGEAAHKKYSPPHRLLPNEQTLKTLNPKEAAVLILLFQDEEQNTNTLLMERVAYNGVHSKQISFPGGKKEASDTDFFHTATREAHEEVAANPNNIEYLGSLSSLYIPPSNFLVYPFVGWYHGSPNFKGNPSEVSELITVKLASLCHPDNLTYKDITIKDQTLRCPAFHVHSKTVWGATAMIISELLEMGDFNK